MRKILLYSLFLFLSCSFLSAQEARNNIDFSQFDTKKPFTDYYANFLNWRLEAGYVQGWQNSTTNTYKDLYLHGGKIGITLDFRLPYNMTMQTGVLYALTYGRTEQHFPSLLASPAHEEYLQHNVMSHQVLIPIRYTYTQPLWKRLALYFYTGPEMAIGIAQKDNIRLENISKETLQWMQDNGIQTQSYDRYAAKELRRFNIQWGLGGGLQWDVYRLQSGYSFGLNDLTKSKNTQMWEWGWYVSFAWQFK